MTEEKYYSAIDATIEKISELIESRDAESLYTLCHSDIMDIMSRESVEIRTAIFVSEVAIEEAKYLDKTILDLTCDDKHKRVINQLVDIFSATSRYLIRIDNDLENDYLMEGLDYLSKKDLSGDFIIRVAKEKTKNIEHVLNYICDGLEKKVVMVLRIYNFLQDKYGKQEYHIKAAFLYMTYGNNEAALKTLDKIKDKTEEVEHMILRLRSIVQ